MLKLKINVKLHEAQLLCIVISVVQNFDFEQFGGFCVDCYYTKLHKFNISSCSDDNSNVYFEL